MSARLPSVRSIAERSASPLPDGEEFSIQAAIDAATDMVFIADDTPAADGGPRIVYANASMNREFGYGLGELLGTTPDFAFGPRTDAATIDRLREAMATMSEANAEFRAYRRDGTSFWTDWRGRGVVDARTRRQRWIAIGRNTDERRRSEDRLAILSTAIENGNDAVFLYSLRGDDPVPRIRYANQAALRNSGYTLQELLGGVNRGGPLTDAAAIAQVVPEMTAGRSLDLQLQLYRRDGTTYWASVHFQPIRDRAGGFSQWICIERDITDEIEREEARTDLMAMIGHDLRNPLTSILGYSEMLLETLTTDDDIQAVQQIRIAGRRLEGLAFELLTVSRMERNAYQPYIEEIDLGAVVRDVLAYMPGSKRVKITGQAEVVVRSDLSAVRHAVENLVSNALKFSSPPTPVLVDLSAADDNFRIRVKDAGIGIPAADLPHIFDRSHRGANVGKRHGTGLGLSFVKRLVNSLGGSVSVKSVEGRGSTFEVQIPSASETSPAA